ncbi:MAG: hypothetical protein K2Q15_15705, partial [Burkholderiales bacterium]|nr:hypothetical protein [Burkholderiales bacterium]
MDFETAPGENLAVKNKTTVQYKINNNTLWLRFNAKDTNAEQIRAQTRERDNISGNDAVGVLIAPAGTGGNEAFAFWVSAAGVQMDSHWSEARQEEDQAWNARWTSEVTRDANGYQVEISIPLSQLPLPANSKQQWGVDFRRSLPREANYQYASQKIDKSKSCMVCLFEPINVELDQGLSLSEFEGAISWLETGLRREESSQPTNHQRESNIGLDLTWRPIRGGSLALVLNPDFSQVES